MSTPTRRDQKRETRKAQFQQRQEERRRARERARRIQLAKRYSFFGGGILALGLAAWGAFAIFSPHPFHYPTSPAMGDTVAGIPCGSTEMTTVHYHANLQVYVNGQQQQVPAGVGIVEPDSVTQQQYAHLTSNGTTACLYYLHTHDASGIIHIESPTNDTYKLGQFFQIWGQQLNKTQVMTDKVDATHQLKVVIIDANGNKTTYTGDPSQITLHAHDTIYLLYNSPSVQPTPFTAWNGA
jgi:hypothetical protein